MPPSYDPVLGCLRDGSETCATYFPSKKKSGPAEASVMGTVQRDADRSYGVLRALDPTTVGEANGEFKYPTPTMAGVMSTASGVVFAGR